MAQITIDDYLSAINKNNSKPFTPSAPRGSVTDKPQDITDAETQAAFTAASGAASELIGVLRRYATGAASKTEATAALNLYKNKLNILKTKNAVAAANIEVSAFGSVITAGLGKPTIASDAKGKTRKIVETEEETSTGDGTPLSRNPNSPYADYTYGSDGIVTNKKGDRQYLVTLPISSKRPGGLKGTNQQFFDTAIKARNSFIDTYYKGNTAALQKQLINSGWSNAAKVKSGEWLKDLDDFISDYTSFTVRESQYGIDTKGKDSTTITEYLSKQKLSAGGGGSASTVGRFLSTRAESNKLINQYLINLIGRPATAQEKEDYFQILNQAENKSTSTRTGGTTTGGYLTDVDRELLAAKIARTAIKTVDVNALLAPGAKGSQTAMDIRDLQSYANQYGIQLDAATALSYVASGLGTEDYLNKQKERIRLNAIAMYPNFAEHIKAGGTIKDVADQYAYARTQKLGVLIPNSVLDKKVMAAMQSGVSIAQYDRDMQAESEWGVTPEAHNIGASFANSILQSFGFGGN